MNTDCTAYRDALRARFDDGADIAAGVDEHAADCAACAAYRGELIALACAFAEMPLEVPRNALVQRVKAQLAAGPAHRNDARWWLPAAAALACVLAGGAAWYFGAPLDPWTWWDYANQAGTTPEWMLRETPLDAELAAAQQYWDAFSAFFAPYPSTLVWGVAACAALLFVGLNGAEAYRLRTRPHSGR